jgi:hypothetical protein
MDSKLSIEDIQIIDQVINKLNELRAVQSLDIDLIETLFLKIKSFFK